MSLRSAPFCLPLLLAAGCKDPVVEVIPGANAELEITLVNPTSCGACNPFTGVDTLKVEVLVGVDEVASDSFAYPDESVVLPDISGFGVVRIQLLGLADGRVISVGRTPEIVLVPGQSLSVPMFFLPANKLLPLAAPMLQGRSRHLALRRRDGSVLLIGGQDARGERVTGTTELWDPVTGTFSDSGPVTSAGAADMMTAPLPGGSTLIAGGYALIGGETVPTDEVTIWNETEGLFEESPRMSQARNGGCIGMFEERQGLALGGAPDAGDYLKPDADTGDWVFATLAMRDFDPGAVTGCAPLGDGTLFVQGMDAPSTGIWDGGAGEPAEAFTPVSPGTAGEIRYVEGAVVRGTEGGGAWVIGGADVTTGQVYADGRVFAPDVLRFDLLGGFATPRFAPDFEPWIEDGWYAAGCGWADADRTEEEPSIELLAPESGENSPLFTLDRARPGCAMTVLRDGALLVTGGYDPDEAPGDDAGLLVPYIDPTRSG